MDYYSELGKGYRELHWAEQAQKLGVLSIMMDAKPAERLLDVGCGPGWAKDFFDCEYHGIDPAVEQVKGRKGCIVGSAEDLPFADSSFELVICVTALHNMRDPEKALSEMDRVCSDRLGITILKRSLHADELAEMVNSRFKVLQRVDQAQDQLLLCRKK